MKNRCKILVFAAACALLAVPAVSHSMSHEEMPAPEGRALSEYITQINPYEQWPLWPGKDKFYQGIEPHGALLTTYVNDPALEGIEEHSGKVADGAIIVKENYMPDKMLAAVTVMYKKDGFNPEAGDFFWLKYAPDGKILAEGKAKTVHQLPSRRPGRGFSVYQ